MSWKRWRGKELNERTRKAMAAGLYNAASATLGETQKQVPLDEGTLQESGIVVVNPDNGLEVAISYGGGPGTGFPRVPYAIKWHEIEANFQHGRKTDYLRDPIKTFAPTAVGKELKKAGAQAW